MLLYKELKLDDDKDLYIIGDLHGAFELYQHGKKRLGIKETDYVISLGDLIDRGKKNLECVTEFTKKDHKFMVLGNHEDMMVQGMLEGSRQHYECWFYNGGNTTLDELGEEGCTLLSILVENAPVVLVVHHRGQTLGFIHGGYPSVYEHLPLTDIPKLEWEEWKKKRFAESLVWDRDMFQCACEGMKLPPVLGVDFVFHGHSPAKEPLINGNRVYMDCGGIFNGNLAFAWLDNNKELKFYLTGEDNG